MCQCCHLSTSHSVCKIIAIEQKQYDDTVLTCTFDVPVVLLTLKYCLAVTAHVYAQHEANIAGVEWYAPAEQSRQVLGCPFSRGTHLVIPMAISGQ